MWEGWRCVGQCWKWDSRVACVMCPLHHSDCRSQATFTFLVCVYLSPVECDPASQFMCAEVCRRVVGGWRSVVGRVSCVVGGENVSEGGVVFGKSEVCRW